MARLFIFIAACLIGGGCYEGWDYSPNANNDVGSAPSAKPKIKPIFYLLFEPIHMASDAMQNATCFPDVGIRTFRSNEWTMRMNAALTALHDIADTVVERDTAIAAAGCTSLATIQFRSLNTTPWVPDAGPADEPTDRPVIHLKAVFWEGEPASSPPSFVTQNWAGWAKLKSSGRNATSLLYMDNTGASNGYFSLWMNEAVADHHMQATLLEPVDQTPQGETTRGATIDSDTAALAAWVAGQAP